MPTTITSSGITFNDATSLSSANIGTAQIADGSVNLQKLASVTQARVAKAWVNFNGLTIATVNASSANTISCNSGSTTGTWIATGWASSDVGTIYKITQISGVAGGTLGGVDVSTLGVQIISVVAGSSATFRFLSGTTSSAQSVTGTGSSSSGFSFISTGIRSSLNVSSITKIGTGDYTVNFATPMADANYSINISTLAGLTDTQWTGSNVFSQTTTSCEIIIWRGGVSVNRTLENNSIVSFVVFGN